MDREIAKCDECGSQYFRAASEMGSLCPHCAHYLYGYDNCDHAIKAGRCLHCGWDGTVSEFVRAIQEQA